MAVRTLLKGMHHGYRARKDGSRVYYYWAWKGGPQIWRGDQLPLEIPDDHPAAVGYRNALKDAKPGRADGFVAGLIAEFRESSDFLGMADSTRYQWTRWLDRIDDEFGELELEGLDERSFRGEVKDWRDKWKATPRQADYALQVLVRVLSYAKEAGRIDFNRAEGIDRLTKANAHAELIWSEDAIKAACAHEDTQREVAFAIRLAALTGLRRGDLTGLLWDEVGADEIARPTNKSGGAHIARIPLLPETRVLLQEIRKHRKGAAIEAVTVLATPSGPPWKESYLTQQVRAAATAAGVDRRLHDLRGTFVTRLCLAGLSDDRIAEICGWSVRAVARMRRTYCSAAAIAKDNVRRLKKRVKSV